MLHLCFCVHDPSGEYYKNTLVALLSVFANTTARITAHILCDATLSPEAKEAFHSLAREYEQELRLIPMGTIADAVQNNVAAKFGPGSLYRLFIPEMLMEETALYLDSDIICTLDIQTLFAYTPKDFCLAGVTDAGQIRHRIGSRKLRRLGLAPQRYINSGVMLMNLEKIRREHPQWREQIFALVAQNKWAFPDQHAINLYFSSCPDGISLLPERFNYCINVENRPYLVASSYEDKILHYTQEKPWNVLTPATLVFWQYHCRLFNNPEIIAVLRGLAPGREFPLFDYILRHERVKRFVRTARLISEQGLLPTLRRKLRV